MQDWSHLKHTLFFNVITGTHKLLWWQEEEDISGSQDSIGHRQDSFAWIRATLRHLKFTPGFSISHYLMLHFMEHLLYAGYYGKYFGLMYIFCLIFNTWEEDTLQEGNGLIVNTACNWWKQNLNSCLSDSKICVLTLMLFPLILYHSTTKKVVLVQMKLWFWNLAQH